MLDISPVSAIRFAGVLSCSVDFHESGFSLPLLPVPLAPDSRLPFCFVIRSLFRMPLTSSAFPSRGTGSLSDGLVPGLTSPGLAASGPSFSPARGATG